MSFEDAAWAIKQQINNPTEKLILIILADCANSETSLCFPSNAYIQRHACCSEATVRRALRKLEDSGFIVTTQRTGKSSLYHLNRQHCTSLDNNPNQFDTPVTDDCPPPSNRAPTPVMGEPLTNNNQEVNQENIYTVNFERFWASYPCKAKKKKSHEIWLKLTRGMDEPTLNRFVEMLIFDVNERKKLKQWGFEKMHPTTYLNGERWTDAYPEESGETDFSSHSDFVNRHTDTSWAE